MFCIFRKAASDTIAFITKSLLDHSVNKKSSKFSPAAGINWIIKLQFFCTPKFFHSFEAVSDSSLLTKSLLGHSEYINLQNFRLQRAFTAISP